MYAKFIKFFFDFVVVQKMRKQVVYNFKTVHQLLDFDWFNKLSGIKKFCNLQLGLIKSILGSPRFFVKLS